MQIMFVGLTCFLAGAKIGASGNAPHLPVVGGFFPSTVPVVVNAVVEDKVEPPVPPPVPDAEESSEEEL
jgi:hypothetical protein